MSIYLKLGTISSKFFCNYFPENTRLGLDAYISTSLGYETRLSCVLKHPLYPYTYLESLSIGTHDNTYTSFYSTVLSRRTKSTLKEGTKKDVVKSLKVD